MRRFTVLVTLALGPPACSDPPDGDPFASGGSGALTASGGSENATDESPPDGATSEGGGPTSGSSNGAADSGGDEPTFDVGTDDPPPPTCGPRDDDCGCNAVDLLFVIDNSGSMQPYQDALAETFPFFIDEIIASLPPGTDLHVGISSSSFGDPSAGGVGSSGCSNEQYNAEAMAEHYPPPSEPNGQNGGQGRLYEYQGKRYFAMNTSDDPSALESWFTGAAVSVGEQGSNWEMVSAGGAWVTHPDNAAHNDGFIRDAGAVLVLFILTDEFDNSPESAQSYHDLVVGAKSQCGGDACVVTGGLTPSCVPDTPSNVLHQFLSAFGEPPVLGDVGSENDTSHYPDVLGAALAEIIAQTCDEIPPAG
jgi:hypothetical protein